MDIARPDLKQKRKRRLLIWAGVGMVVLAALAGGRVAAQAGRAHGGPLDHLDRTR